MYNWSTRTTHSRLWSLFSHPSVPTIENLAKQKYILPQPFYWSDCGGPGRVDHSINFIYSRAVLIFVWSCIKFQISDGRTCLLHFPTMKFPQSFRTLVNQTKDLCGTSISWNRWPTRSNLIGCCPSSTALSTNQTSAFTGSRSSWPS